jgi:site-specific recombinase XerD
MELHRDFLEQIDSRHTRRAYRTDLSHFLDHLRDEDRLDGIDEVEARDIRAYVRALQADGLSRSTQRRRLSALRRFYDWLMDQGDSDRNPARTCRVDLTKPPENSTSPTGTTRSRVLDKPEAERLIRATEAAGCAAVRDRGLLLTILYGALRRAEVAAMDVEHVRPLGRHWVIDLPAGDSWSSAYVKIPEAVVEAIEQVQSRYDIEEGALWRSLSNRNRGARLTPDAIYKIVRRTGRRADLGDVTVDVLRRTGLHLAVRAGASLQQVQVHGRLQSVASVENLGNENEQPDRLGESAVDFVDLDV